MAASTRAAVSQILRNKDDVAEDRQDEEPKKKSREDWRKAKELEEARKAGTAPAAVDEEGKDINPHIPQYISSAPWYYGTAGPTLKHQRPQEERESHFSHLDDYYKKGVDTNSTATKYRKGACENCGAITHKKKDCLERPRKVGARYTNTKIAPDEFVQPKLTLGFDGKRDRWNGYDPSEHKAIIEEYQKIEDAKREMRAQKLEQDPSAVDDKDEEDDAEEDEDKYVDGVDMPGTKVDSKQRITVRNLRIREDTAKYLRNLDPNSAYYDPKTRSMRDNPNPKEAEHDYSGENFVRFSGDTQKHAGAQLFAWEAHDKGVDVHLLAEPTKLEVLQKEYEKKKEQFKSQVKDSVLDKYGGAEYLKVPPKVLLLAQTETFTQYNRDGTLIQGQEKQVARSKYEEDVLINNHTCIWGSFWKAGKWGYKCCHSYVKMSYCVGEAGKSVILEMDHQTSVDNNEAAAKSLRTDSSLAVSSIKSESDGESSSSSSGSEGKIKSKTEKVSSRKKKKKKEKKKDRKDKRKSIPEKDKLEMALRSEEKSQRHASLILEMDERKRPYNSMKQVKEPTEEEMEAYFMKRQREDDPMNQFNL